MNLLIKIKGEPDIRLAFFYEDQVGEYV